MINFFLLNACINGKKTRHTSPKKRYHLKISTGYTNYTIHKKAWTFYPKKQKLKESVILSQLFLGLFFLLLRIILIHR